MEVKLPENNPVPVDPKHDVVNDRIKKNIQRFRDPFEGLPDAAIRKMSLSDTSILLMIYERLGHIGRLLEERL